MRRAYLPRFCSIGCVLIAVVNGCDIRNYKVVTRIEQDGSFVRSITQSRDNALPPEALAAPKTYPPASQPADYVIRQDWADLWNVKKPDLRAKEGDEVKLVEAGGTFPTADRIPRNYHLPSYPLDDRASVNRIVHRFDDLGLFGLDDWTETVTETIQLDEYVDTVDEMIHMLLPPAQATFDELFGEKYDFSELHTFGRERLAPIARRFALILFQAGCQGGGAQPQPEHWRMLKEMLCSVGFELPLDEQGTEPDGKMLETNARQYCRDLFTMTVRLKASHKYLTVDQAEDLLLTLGWKPESDAQKQPAPTPDEKPAAPGNPAAPSQPATQASSPWNQFGEIFDRHFLATNGRTAESMMLLWGARSGGAHRAGPLSFFDPAPKPDNREFRYALTTAGPIIDTNGQLVASNAVEWSFAVNDLWPLGYKMHAIALRWNRDAETKLFGHPVLPDLNAVLELRATIGNRQPVKDAIKLAVEQGSLDPLRKLAAGENDEAKASQEILKLATRPAP